jgi:hypothetical protein
MHIQDFHSKLTSANRGVPLFEALRSLNQIEDPKEIFREDNNFALLKGGPKMRLIDTLLFELTYAAALAFMVAAMSLLVVLVAQQAL